MYRVAASATTFMDLLRRYEIFRPIRMLTRSEWCQWRKRYAVIYITEELASRIETELDIQG